MSQTYFCHNCGQALTEGARFCISCGASISIDQEKSPLHSPVENTKQQKMQRSGQRISLPAIIIGLLLLLFGLRLPILGLFGMQTRAIITETRQIVNSTSSKMDYNYNISYSYTDHNDKMRHSSYQMNRVYNISSLPAINSTISIKYLPVLPYISAPTSQSNGYSALIFIALGLFLTILSFRGKLSGSVKKRN